jgi:hypothetical protein
MYEAEAAGTSPLDRLVPVGVTWGNDPDLTPAKAAAGEKPKESWVNPASKAPHVGWLGRLNGPVDNPNSSCLSCHGRAGAPQTNALVFPAKATEAEQMAFFANVKAGEPYAAGVKSLYYSLQLGIGIRNFPGPGPAPTAAHPAVPAGFNPRAGEVDPEHPADASGPDPERRGPAGTGASPAAPAPAKWTTTTLIIVGAALLAVIVITLYVVRRKRMPPTARPPRT